MSGSRAQFVRQLANTLLHLIAALGVVFAAFAMIYWWVEDYKLLDSFYWSMQTISTTGYGDVSPQTDAGKIVAMALQPTALLLTALFFANFAREAIIDPDAFTHAEQTQMRNDLSEIKSLMRHIAGSEVITKQ